MKSWPSRYPPLLDSEEAGRLLQVPAQQVALWARKGRLQGYRAGRRWRFTERQLMRFLGGAENDTLNPYDAPVRMVSGTSGPLQGHLGAFEQTLAEDLRHLTERQSSGDPAYAEVPSPQVARQAAADLKRALRPNKYL